AKLRADLTRLRKAINGPWASDVPDGQHHFRAHIAQINIGYALEELELLTPLRGHAAIAALRALRVIERLKIMINDDGVLAGLDGSDESRRAIYKGWSNALHDAEDSLKAAEDACREFFPGPLLARVMY